MSARYEMVESETTAGVHDDERHCVYQPDQAMSSLDGMHVFADGDGTVVTVYHIYAN